MELFKKIWRNERGNDVAEYTLLITLAVLSFVSAVSGLKDAVGGVFGNQAAMVSFNTSAPSGSSDGSGSGTGSSSSSTSTKGNGKGNGNGGGNGKAASK